MPPTLEQIPGWFWPADQRLFDWFLSQDGPGDLLELGAYLGKSAVLIGRHLREGERFTVCDLFESEAPDAANDAETTRSYSTLTRRRFEENYLGFHDTLPEIVHGPTSEILIHVKPDSCRFVHVDASHLYAHVRQDVLAARTVLRADGVVVFDDYRSEHTPGVSLAVWEAVSNLGLAPICVSTQKLYATWGDAEAYRARLLAWLEAEPELWHAVDELGDQRLVRVNQHKKPKQATDLAELKRITTELKRTSAELKRTTAELRSRGPVVRRALRWTRRIVGR